ncbi:MULTISPECIES: phage baseplate assembly protein V [unclassified Pseudomonas]|uniref:phage baseplate assembly protein V n=1 Tax=unclassified Pseudomonas TaxID=196821 RepID=UPI002446B11A|nr:MULTISPECIES: phage baseplate assembly protein V [unclassified Pseudomonas]MDH0894349.1 phage baseplate assembly protein V [Pseudomonas sp. GD03875]MDH1063356.1 phage baseplate assembly protein V [Pseudomonas sp. GD03985]
MSVELEYGFVSAVDLKLCRIKVRLPDRDDLQSHWLTVPQRATKGTKRRPLMPELGEQVAVLLDEDGVRGTYLGGVYFKAEPPPVTDPDTDYVRFSDGTAITYNRASGQLLVDSVGTVVVNAATSAQVTAPQVTVQGVTDVVGDTTITGNLQVAGNIHATGSIIDTGGNTPNHSH